MVKKLNKQTNKQTEKRLLDCGLILVQFTYWINSVFQTIICLYVVSDDNSDRPTCPAFLDYAASTGEGMCVC